MTKPKAKAKKKKTTDVVYDVLFFVNFYQGEFAMKSFLTLMFLLFSCQPAGETVYEQKTFIDADACSIEYDYQYGLYQLKNAETGESSEVAIEIERAGRTITALRIKQVGNSAPAEQVNIKGLVENEQLTSYQEEADRFREELETLQAKHSLDPFYDLEAMVGLARKTQGERETVADLKRRKQQQEKQQEIIDRLLGSVRQEIESLREQTADIDRQASNLREDLREARQKRLEALHRIKVVKYGLPRYTLFGTDASTGTQGIWLHINEHGIWGIDISYLSNGEQQSMSYDPFKNLGSIENMEEANIRNRHFPTGARNCGSNSGGSGL